jgi:hypothetical protein
MTMENRSSLVLVVTLVGTISATFFINPSLHKTHAVNETKTDEDMQNKYPMLDLWLQQLWEKDAAGWLQVFFAVAAIALTLVLYAHQQSKERKEAVKRSCGAILREIEENKKLLESKEYEKIEYNIQDQLTGPNNIVKYTNAYLDSEAYKSILHSGFFTFFDVYTQHKLTLLYERIHGRNELISYVDHFQDLYFLYNDNSKANLDKWYKKVERYDILLTKWEEEILNLLDEVKLLLNKNKQVN